MTAPLLKRYEARVAADGLRHDPAQVDVVARLDALRAALSQRPTGWLPRRTPPAPQGLYVWGDVGRGKSMLVDLLAADLGGAEGRRIHFHAFMSDIHAALHLARQSGADDPLAEATDSVAGRIDILILDEVEVTDIADAMIVGRVCGRLFSKRIALVATSNSAPDDLYRDGLKREHFVPFVRLIEANCEVVHLAGPRDYRGDDGQAGATYLTPAGPEAARRIDEVWEGVGRGTDHLTLGRTVRLPRRGATVRGSFDELCRSPLTAGDYLGLAEQARTLLLEGVPRLGKRDDDTARRFMLLIDTLYDARRALVVSAAAPPDDLMAEGAFESAFRRTASRLKEMTGPNWPPADRA